MPKQEYIVNDFSGGLVTAQDPLDMQDNELTVLSGGYCDESGRITVMTMPGDYSTVAFPLNVIDGVEAGYGLFRFDADHAVSTATSSHQYVCISGYSATGRPVAQIMDMDYNVLTFNNYLGSSTSYIALSTTVSPTVFQPMFYYADGGLRICDASLNTALAVRWVGYIDRTNFEGILPGASGAATYDGWYEESAEIQAPLAGLVGTLVGTADNSTDADGTTLLDTGFWVWSATDVDGKDYNAVNITDDIAVHINSIDSANQATTDDLGAPATWQNGTYYVYPPSGEGFNLNVTTTVDSASTWDAATYEFASTFIYDENQESPLFEMSGTLAVASGRRIDAQVFYTFPPLYKRHTGGRIYIRKSSSNDDWSLLLDIDLRKGVRKDLQSEYMAWSLNLYWAHSTNDYWVNCPQDSYMYIWNQNPDTYKSLTGIDYKTTTLSAKYKCAAIASRMAYIGNVLYDGVVYEDSVFKSFVNRFDSFTKERRIDVVTGDGETVVNLIEYADRLLIFKENTLYILNISQDIEFLEAKYKYMGIKRPYQVVKTDYGVVWANRLGAYMYDGQRVYNLLYDLTDQSTRKISESTWNTYFVGTTSDSDDKGVVGYQPINQRSFFILDMNYAVEDVCSALVFNLKSGKWELHPEIISTDDIITNTEVDPNGYMMWYEHENDTELLTLNTNSPTTIFLITKDYNFGNMSKKRFYGIDITYNKVTTATSILTRYRINGLDSVSSFTSVNLPVASAKTTQRMTVETVQDIRSVKITMSGSPLSTFVIDSISFIIRQKSAR